jgi:hypothetical protein
LVPTTNRISEFRAAQNELEVIEHKLIKRLKKAQLIDFSENICVDLVYEKGSMEINSFHSLVYMECSEEDD